MQQLHYDIDTDAVSLALVGMLSDTEIHALYTELKQTKYHQWLNWYFANQNHITKLLYASNAERKKLLTPLPVAEKTKCVLGAQWNAKLAQLCQPGFQTLEFDEKKDSAYRRGLRAELCVHAGWTIMTRQLGWPFESDDPWKAP